jgi:anhydro-N-acetylmuramic acid kinase
VRIEPSEPRLLLGMGSGTSADAVDLALVRVTGAAGERRVESLGGTEAPLARELREAVRRAPRWSLAEVAAMHAALGRAFGEAARGFLDERGIAPAALAAVGSHGQTVHHHDGDPAGGTLQLGDPAWIAALVGAPVVADFRWNDLAAGGQGAPISPFADQVLHRPAHGQRVILNLGGIANLTLLDATAPPRAWDSGPANGPLDALMRLEAGEECDRDGRRASAGRVRQELLAVFREDPWFARPLPRSTGLERFGEPLAGRLRAAAPDASLEDLLASACAGVAWSVADSLQRAGWRGGEVRLCGGGARNPVLVKALRNQLEPAGELLPYAGLGWDPDLREAVAFALLADAFLCGEPATWAGTTGAVRPALLGRWIPAPVLDPS